jgi:hypothetical protein
MRVQKRNPWLTGLGVVLAVIALSALSGGRADALVASDQAGSVVIYPKVIADGTRDTIISLTNTSNMQAYVHCEYVQGIGICQSSLPGAPIFCTPDAPGGLSADCNTIPGDVCEVNWQNANFDLILTRQQPTFWRVSTGRFLDVGDIFSGSACREEVQPDMSVRLICPGFFFTSDADPLNPTGNLPPPPGGGFFRGELKCFQTDSSTNGLMPGDALKGEATIETVGTPLISRYNSINIQGEENATNDLVLKLNSTPNRTDGLGEFNACPETIEFTHFGNQASNFIAAGLSSTACDGSQCPVRTEITVMPCTENFEADVGAQVGLLFEFFDEFEVPISSADVLLDCWANYDLDDLTTVDAPSGGSTFWKTRVTPMGSRCRSGNIGAPCNLDPSDPDAPCGPGGVCGPASGILAVVEQFYETDSTTGGGGSSPPGTSALNTTMVNGDGVDLDSVRSGRCRGALNTRCENDSDCTGGGFCRIASTMPCTSDSQCGGGDFCDVCMFDEIIFSDLE